MHHIVRFQSGAKLPYWGRLARLHTQASDVKTPKITYRHGFHISHPSYSDPHQHDFEIEQAIHRFLKDKFADQVEVFVREYSDKLGLSPTVVRIRQMRTRWGSCSSSGCISLDWRLVYAPKRVASYVVAHELAHLKVMNHGPGFWNTLSMIFGEYDDAHHWLKKNDHLLGYVKLPIGGVQHVTG
jgi:predicted metal-dependent hydrolase